jgi:hypothetical protein
VPQGDVARAISTLVEEQATHRAFLEIKVNELLEQCYVGTAQPPGWEQACYSALIDCAIYRQCYNTGNTQVYYLVKCGSCWPMSPSCWPGRRGC